MHTIKTAVVALVALLPGSGFTAPDRQAPEEIFRQIEDKNWCTGASITMPGGAIATPFLSWGNQEQWEIWIDLAKENRDRVLFNLGELQGAPTEALMSYRLKAMLIVFISSAGKQLAEGKQGLGGPSHLQFALHNIAQLTGLCSGE